MGNQSSGESAPSQDLNCAYDQSLFSGRLQHFIRLTSPLNLVRASEQGAIEKAQQTTARYIKHRLPLDERYWEARYLLNATIHPDTKQPIFLPFRMASFVPTNLLITAGLLLPAPSLSTIVFWQWVNQSANVGINWANANHSTKLSIEETAVAYATAVTASVSVAVGLNKVVRGPLLARFVPFVAVATAGALNVFLMRRKELTDGIDVCDEDGRVVGKSTAAGWRAVSQVAVSRVLTALPCLTLPPLVMSVFERTRLYARHRWLSFPLNFGLIGLSLMTALPCAIAVFPQTGKLPIAEAETQYQLLIRKSTGKPVEYLMYNKGL